MSSPGSDHPSVESASPCPCGSGETYAACCAPYLAVASLAPTAEALMRSRYTAFVMGDADHLLRTWHPDTRPAASELAASLADGPAWQRLVVHEASAGGPADVTGVVRFTAVGRNPDGSKARLLETSEFVREGGTWLYVEGDLES